VTIRRALLVLGLVCVALAGSGVARARSAPRGRSVSGRLQVRYFVPAPAALTGAVVLGADGANGPLQAEHVAESDQTVVATAATRQDLLAMETVAFSRPPSGWSSTDAGAVLTASDGSVASDVATSGPTVVVGDGSLGNSGPITAYVFSEPAGGWSGSVHESAKLVGATMGSGVRVGSSVAVSGPNAFVSDGWAGSRESPQIRSPEFPTLARA